MKANELRIGNWVNNNEEDYQITSATIAQLERGDSTAKPILLTEEWLVKFGAEKVNQIDWVLKIGSVVFCFRFYKEWYSSIGSIYLSDRIQYVHQVQNLYYCLCGKELQINITKTTK